MFTQLSCFSNDLSFSSSFVEIVFFHVLVAGKGFTDFVNFVDKSAHERALHAQRAEFLKAAAHTHVAVARGKERRRKRFSARVVFVFTNVSVFVDGHILSSKYPPTPP